MFRFLIVALALLISAPAWAEGCWSPEKVIGIEAERDPEAVPELIEGKQAEDIRAGLEAFSHTKLPEGAVYLVFAVPGNQLVHVVEFINGCVGNHGYVPAQLMAVWRGLAS